MPLLVPDLYDSYRGHFLTPKTMLNTYKTCIKGTIWLLKRVIEEINLLDLHLFVLANTLFSELGNALLDLRKPGISKVVRTFQDRHVGATPPMMKKSRIGTDASIQRSE